MVFVGSAILAILVEQLAPHVYSLRHKILKSYIQETTWKQEWDLLQRGEALAAWSI